MSQKAPPSPRTLRYLGGEEFGWEGHACKVKVLIFSHQQVIRFGAYVVVAVVSDFACMVEPTTSHSVQRALISGICPGEKGQKTRKWATRRVSLDPYRNLLEWRRFITWRNNGPGWTREKGFIVAWKGCKRTWKFHPIWNVFLKREFC